MRALLVAAAGALAGAQDPSIGWADEIVAGLNEGRAAVGAKVLVHDAALDEVARRRTATMASLPEGRRFAIDTGIDQEVDAAGLADFRRASEHLATLAGSRDVGAAAIEQWRNHGPDWRRAMEPEWSRIGAHVRRASDGTFLVAAVLVDTTKPLPARSVIERAVFDAVNSQRRRFGLGVLSWSRRLAEVARDHSRDMVRRRYFDHRSPSGTTPERRVSAAAIEYDALAENIAKNRNSDDPVATTVSGWMSSPPHRAAILEAGFVESGVGVAVAPDGTVHVTQLFLRPRIPGR